ncbi:MAG: hypothetical protein WA432_00820 [Candidatus Babeliaceae bacterium]
MNENPFYTFIQFAQADQDLEKALLDKQKTEHLLEKSAQALANLKQQLSEKQTAVHQLKKKLDVQELENKSLNEILKNKKKRLEATQSPREYQSLHQEIEQLTHKESDQEDLLMDLLTWYEKAQDALKVTQPLIQQEDIKLKTEQEKQRVHIQEIATAITQLQEKRELLQEKVRPEWLQKYQEMKKQVPNPAVPVEKGVCSACYYQVSPSDLQLLRKHSLLHCKDCYRFLYIL